MATREGSSIICFAYGSNMSTARLRARVPSASPRGIACIEGRTLRFHKRSTDGSGKADAHLTGNVGDAVWGVLFEFSEDCLVALDHAEGDGYERVRATVKMHLGDTGQVWTYIAKPHALDESLKPFDWYLQHALAGAREHGLPQEYIAEMERTPTLPSKKGPTPAAGS